MIDILRNAIAASLIFIASIIQPNNPPAKVKITPTQVLSPTATPTLTPTPVPVIPTLVPSPNPLAPTKEPPFTDNDIIRWIIQEKIREVVD